MCSSTPPWVLPNGSLRVLWIDRAAHSGQRLGGRQVCRKLPARRNGPVQQLSDGSVRSELGVAVAGDHAPRDHGATPVLHHAKAVPEDGVGGVGTGQVRAPVGGVVTQLADYGHHLVERVVDEPQEVADGDDEHGGLPVAGRPTLHALRPEDATTSSGVQPIAAAMSTPMPAATATAPAVRAPPKGSCSSSQPPRTPKTTDSSRNVATYATGAALRATSTSP